MRYEVRDDCGIVGGDLEALCAGGGVVGGVVGVVDLCGIIGGVIGVVGSIEMHDMGHKVSLLRDVGFFACLLAMCI